MADDPFSGVPLFAELQRLLTSSSGPINWELARQVATASALSEGDPPAVGDFTEAVRIAEMQLTQLNGIEPPLGMPAVRVVRRSFWVSDTVERLPEFVEPSARRVAEGFAQMQGDPSEAPVAAPGMFGSADVHQALGAVMALVQGIQTGSVIGAMASNAFASYDVCIPRADEQLSFVEPNITAFERDWSLPTMEFRLWVAIREVALRAALAQPWTRTHLLDILRDAAASMEVDVTEMQSRMEHLDILSDPTAMQELMQGGGSLFDPIMDDEQRLKLARVQAFIASAEGFGAHVTDTIASRMLSVGPQIVEAVHRLDRGASQLFPRVLGIEIFAKHLEMGRRFCDVVADQTDEATLARMWDTAEALPSMPELEEPRLWMARVA